MTPASLLTDDWDRTIERLGGTAALAAAAHETKAFAWGRKIPNPVVLLRLVLAYCLGEWGLRSTTAWAAAIGLADLSNVALLYRLRRCGDWLAWLVGQVLAASAPDLSQGRLIRIIDASSVPKAGRSAKRKNGLWRIHSAFDLPSERFGHFVLTDEHEGALRQAQEAGSHPGRAGRDPHCRPRPSAAGSHGQYTGGWRRCRGASGLEECPLATAALRQAQEASRLICSIGCARPRAIGSMCRSGLAAGAVRRWRCA